MAVYCDYKGRYGLTLEQVKGLVAEVNLHREQGRGFLEQGGGYVIPGGSALAKKIKKLVEAEGSGTSGAIPIYEEQGVYAGYIRMDRGSALRGPTERVICPLGEGNARQPRT